MSELLHLTSIEAGVAAVVLLAAAYIRGLTGFGFSAVTVAGLSFVMDPAEAVAIAIMFEVAASVLQTPGVWHDIKWPQLGALLAAAAFGGPIGVWIQTTVEPDTLRVLAFGAILLLTIGLLIGGSSNIVPTLPIYFAVGLVAGVVNGATALAGLVIVLALSFMRVEPIELRASLIAYFFVSDLWVLLWLAGRDELSGTDLWRVVVGFPLLVAGILAGSKAFTNISPEKFRRVTLWLLVALAMAGLARTLLVG